MIVAFRVDGIAQPKGSTKSFRFTPRRGREQIRTVNDNDANAGWAAAVKWQAIAAMRRLPVDDRAPLRGPVRLTLACYLPRPKKFQRPGLHIAHLTRPDASKLLRSIEDALTNVVYVDDSQVTDVVVLKRYAAVGANPHVDVWVEPTGGIALIDREVVA
jgi:Holliday junction resolvase RusA-like endonuclease